METQGNAVKAFPNDPLFAQLLERSQAIKHDIIKDQALGVTANYNRLLGDVVALQDTLREQLPLHLLDSCGRINGGVSIAILAPTGYEFLVALYTLLAIGAIVVPLREASIPNSILADEANEAQKRRITQPKTSIP